MSNAHMLKRFQEEVMKKGCDATLPSNLTTLGSFYLGIIVRLRGVYGTMSDSEILTRTLNLRHRACLAKLQRLYEIPGG